MAEPKPENPTARQFDRWIRPSDALTLLAPLSSNTIAADITERLQQGMLYAAGTASEAVASGVNDPRHVIESDWWRRADALKQPGMRFWSTGTVTLSVPVDSRRPSQGTRDFHFTGVRFEPEGIQRFADDAGLAKAISPNAKLAAAMVKRPFEGPDPMFEAMSRVLAARAPPLIRPNEPVMAALPLHKQPKDTVSSEEAWAWFNALSLEDQQRPWRWLWPAVRAAFLPRHVLKKHALEFVAGRDRGRRRKTTP